jgi:hypothetical protein
MNISSMVNKISKLMIARRGEHMASSLIKDQLTKELKAAVKLCDDYENEIIKFYKIIEENPEWIILKEVLDLIIDEQLDVIKDLTEKKEEVKDNIWDIEAAFYNANCTFQI